MEFGVWWCVCVPGAEYFFIQCDSKGGGVISKTFSYTARKAGAYLSPSPYTAGAYLSIFRVNFSDIMSANFRTDAPCMHRTRD